MVSNEKEPGWLGYIGDYTTQLYRDCNETLIRIPGSLLINEDSMERLGWNLKHHLVQGDLFNPTCFGKGSKINRRIHVWYIYLHLVDFFYDKCR